MVRGGGRPRKTLGEIIRKDLDVSGQSKVLVFDKTW